MTYCVYIRSLDRRRADFMAVTDSNGTAAAALEVARDRNCADGDEITVRPIGLNAVDCLYFYTVQRGDIKVVSP